MAADTEPSRAPLQGPPPPVIVRPAGRPWWLRPGVHTAVLAAAAGYVFGHWLGNALGAGWQQTAPAGQNNLSIVLGYAFLTLGWLAGLGVFTDLLRMMAGRPVPHEEEEAEARYGLARYFEYSLDHKVVGLQYLVGMIIYFCTAGLFAMAIRAELLSPTYHLFSSATYIEIVSEHGTMMMMLMSSLIVGPFGNYLVPLMIGAKRVAFPRIEALSFWLTVPAFLILLSSLLIGGFPFGWTGYPPLSIQATEGADSYAFAFGLMGFSILLAGFNLVATIICYRAPGMRWSRLPIFVWSILTTSFILVLAAPVLIGGMYMMLTDRTVQTAFFADQLGGSAYLYENLFWFFGHPEVYILILPAFGVVSELMPVFCRKPLFGYRVSAAGMLGVGLLSFFVWQHHLFVSGLNPDMRPLFMLTTELISVPTGFIFLVALGTLWKAKIRFTVPMLFVFAFFFNFLIGGVTGVFLSDVPADITAHGSFFVLAHFHYTIMGGMVFAFMAAIYYWLPKMTGIRLNQTLGKIQFWVMFVAFNSTFLPMFAIGMLGQPRRVFEYARNLETLNDWASISAFVLGGSILIFVANFVWSTVIVRQRETGNPWQSRGLEWQTASPPPHENFRYIPVVLAPPYEYGVRDASPVADLNPPPGVLAAAYADDTGERAEAAR